MALALARPRGFPIFRWIRITVRLLAMVLLLLVCVPLYYPFKLFTPHKHIPRFFLGGVAKIAGVRLRQRGEPVRRGAFFLVNHVSWIDIPALSATTGCAFVGHDGLSSIPLIKWLCAMNDTVFVARYDRTSVAQQIDDVRQAISETGALAIFPEGTTSDGTGLLPFKSSLLSALEPLPEGIAVQPVLLQFGPEAAEVAWVGDEHGLDNFIRILGRRRPVDLTVQFLAPLSGAQLENRKSIAQAAREELLRELAAR